MIQIPVGNPLHLKLDLRPLAEIDKKQDPLRVDSKRVRLPRESVLEPTAKQLIDSLTENGSQHNNNKVKAAQLAYFCPRRFSRFPRFTIFSKKGQQSEENQYEVENTVSLNADFMRLLVENQSKGTH